uniref:Uncharacterized protein n=1 Tax=Oryza barthii TaxID=65489 RepID=A0A0D3F455_9ORYZ
MNEYLAEDRDPVRCWVVAAAIAFVALLSSTPDLLCLMDELMNTNELLLSLSVFQP